MLLKNVSLFSRRDVGVAPTVAVVGATPTSRLKKNSSKKPNPHSKELRKGRYSSPNQIYLITTVTRNREPVFTDFTAARQLIIILKNEQKLHRAETLAFVIMPDHLHWLMTLGHERTLSHVLQSIKTLSAKKVGRPIWQEGFHDHALRREEDLQSTARYIVANPLRAGLVTRVGDYPHWDAIWL